MNKSGKYVSFAFFCQNSTVVKVKINAERKKQISENKKIILADCGHRALAFACRLPFMVQ